VTLMVMSLMASILAAIPAWLFWKNLSAYQPPPRPARGATLSHVSVLIPARNEEQTIRAAVAAALASEGVELEVVVLDDDSEDETAAIVRYLAGSDNRVRLLNGPELPDGWCGKQHACWVLARGASSELLFFQDADVRLAPEGLARMVAFLEQSGADLVSGIPCQETGTYLEYMVIPLIHFLLLGFLPIERMRASRDPAYGAGCGQLFLARRSSYDRAGGHAAIRGTLHDGIKLPRAFRAAGLTTDLCDATQIARCRMYRGGRALWDGLAKNAYEGLGTATLIVPISLLLLLGQVLPIVLVGLTIWRGSWAVLPAMLALACSYYPRLAGLSRFRQSILGALLHPVGIVVILAIQWWSLLRRALGRPSRWKGRKYGSFTLSTSLGTNRLPEQSDAEIARHASVATVLPPRTRSSRLFRTVRALRAIIMERPIRSGRKMLGQSAEERTR
jgi:Glycosyl transferase family 2